MGTHNSYHIAPPTSVLTFLSSPIVASLLGNQTDAVPSSWEVTMQPVQQQFENYGASGSSGSSTSSCLCLHTAFGRNRRIVAPTLPTCASQHCIHGNVMSAGSAPSGRSFIWASCAALRYLRAVCTPEA